MNDPGASDRSASGGSGYQRPAWPGNAENVDEVLPDCESSWVDVGDISEVVKRKKFVVGDGPDAKVVIVHDNCVYALDNVCIHKQRELVKGVILGDRIICPGHQWAFQLATGFEAKMEQHQPTYPVRITDDGRVEVDIASPSAPRPSATEDDEIEGSRR